LSLVCAGRCESDANRLMPIHGAFFMAMGHDSIMVGKSYRTPGDEVRTGQSIDNDEVVYR
jgi:hypothetical protein